MIRLTQTFGAHSGRVREFDQDVVRCGRLPTNDFAFDAHADLDASGNHAELRREGARWVVVDAGSRNGTLVNGKPIQRHVLDGNEEIEFGTGGPRVRIEIVQGAVPAGPIRAPQATAPATPIDMSPPTAGGAGAAAPQVWTGGGATPAPQARTPAPVSSDPKLYDQRTLDMAVEAAETRGRAAAAANGPTPADLARLESANKQGRTIVFALGAMVVVLLCAVCVLGTALAYLGFRHG
jgi:hypothetical protein